MVNRRWSSNEHDADLLELAGVGDDDRARFIRELVRRRPCTTLDRLRVQAVAA
jgi:hypothetical protein